MKRDVGLWIDRRKAVIVTIAHDGDGIRSVQSNLEKSICFSGIYSQENWKGNMEDRNFTEYLTGYYDEVIAYILDADSIQIFGPGEAKLQLERRLRHEALGDHIVSVETAEKMTDRQIEAKVWKHFLTNQS